MQILSIVESAYRGTLEEQDDTVLWINHALRNNGASVSLLLRGNAVNYLARGQDASGLAFGERRLVHPPQPDESVAKLIAAGVPVYAVDEDLVERGLASHPLVSGVERVRRSGLPELLERFEHVWHW
jgi:hypothetical protein